MEKSSKPKLKYKMVPGNEQAAMCTQMSSDILIWSIIQVARPS